MSAPRHGGTLDADYTLTRNTAAAVLIERCGQLYVSTRPNAAQGSRRSRSSCAKPQVARWMGRRASLPDGLPILGAAPKFAYAFFAFGNSHFGISAGPVMGRLIAEIVAGREPGIDITPFSPPRFGGA